MTINLSRQHVSQISWRQGAVLASLLLIVIGSSHVAAQKNSKRITALQLGDGAEGSRVTIVSDGALNDYEAFRRGDRFYVKIPLAELAAAAPGFRGDGFDDVQVQRLGDGVVISFKLQPGATARVDQRANRLDVIFFAPNRVARVNNPTVAPTRVSTNSPSNTVRRRNSDSAGPVPPGSPQPSNPTVVSEAAVTETTTDGQSAYPALPPSVRNSSFREKNRNASAATATPSVSPTVAPTYTFPTAVTPAVAEQSRPITTPAPARSSLRDRGQAVVRWVSTNRMVVMLVGLGVLVLVGVVALVLYGRRTKVAKSKNVMERAQPKFSPDVELEDVLNRSGEFAPAAGVRSHDFGIDTWVLKMQSRPSTSSFEVSDEQEREVFEL